MLALIKDNQTISTHAVGTWVRLPDGSMVAPAYDGWTDGEYRLELVVPEVVEPEPVDPLTIPLERLDFWLAAAAAGVSKWSVRDRIASMPEGPQKNAAIAYFEDALRYRRYDPLLIQMALAEGIDAERLDQLWREAVEASA